MQHIVGEAERAQIVLQARARARALFARDERLFKQQLAAVDAALSEHAIVLVVRRGEHEPVVVEREVVDIFRLADRADKADGDLAGFQHPVHLLAVAAAQGITELRLALQKRGEVARHQILPRHGGRAERDHGGAVRVGEQRAQRGAVIQNAPCDGVDLFALLRQANMAAVGAHEQLLAERLLQKRNVRAHGGLVEEQLLRRTGEAAVFHNGDKNFKLLEADIVHKAGFLRNVVLL